MMSEPKLIRDREYFLTLGREDYYADESPGQWWGKGARALSLSGTVAPDALRNLMDGFSPTSRDRPLVRSAGKDNHRAGYDFVFTAPKSVSTLWASGSTDVRHIIEQAHDAAVGAALTYLEDTAAWTRLGRGGVQRERVGLVVARYRHGTARPVGHHLPDPNLHTHCLALVGVLPEIITGQVDPAKNTRTLDGKPFFQAKMEAGTLYRLQLSYELEKRLGLSLERKKSWFEIAHVPDHLLQWFSKRRNQIEEALRSHGYASSAASAVAAVTTRARKEHVPYGVLFSYWQEQAEKHGFGPTQAQALLHRAEPKDPEAEIRAAFQEALQKITRTHSHFRERDLIRHTAEAAQGRGLSAAAVSAHVRTELRNSPQIVCLGKKDEEIRYALQSVVHMEREMLSAVERSRGQNRHRISERALRRAVRRIEKKASRAKRRHDPKAGPVRLSVEQREALRHITRGPDGVAVVSGLAGTGKTTLLAAANEGWKQRFHVIGGAVSGIAAEGLEKGTGIKSHTVHKILQDLDSTFLDSVTHHLRQIGRAALHKPTYCLNRVQLRKNSVLVIDEAGQLSTAQLARLVSHVERAGARLVLVGDADQLQSVEAGGAFHTVARQLGAAQLKEITRQKEAWARQAVHDLSQGKAKEALDAFAERGLVSVADNRDHAMRDLIAAWKKYGVTRPQDALIFTGSNYDAAVLNRLAQAERIKAGEVGGLKARVSAAAFFVGTPHVKAGNDTILQNDRVLFTRNSTYYGVKNGTIATAVGIDPVKQTLTVRLDDGKEVTISLRHYGTDHLRLAYAVTSHKGQGATVDRAFVLAGGSMQDKEISYVQASRAREETSIFTDREEAGDDLSRLTRAMSRSRKKELAHEVYHHQEQETPRHEHRQRLAL